MIPEPGGGVKNRMDQVAVKEAGTMVKKCEIQQEQRVSKAVSDRKEIEPTDTGKRAHRKGKEIEGRGSRTYVYKSTSRT